MSRISLVLIEEKERVDEAERKRNCQHCGLPRRVCLCTELLLAKLSHDIEDYKDAIMPEKSKCLNCDGYGCMPLSLRTCPKCDGTGSCD
jgi:hypothetical protein